MPKITYIEHKGKSHTLEVANGLTVMEGAIQNNISGIDADCGGSCACATCHVYVEEKWFNKLQKKDEAENIKSSVPELKEMLDIKEQEFKKIDEPK